MKPAYSILALGDDAKATGLIRSSLSAQGFSVDAESDISEGFRKFIETEPDLVILDIDTFLEHGIVYLREFCEADPCAKIICTGSDRDDARFVECIRCGALDYLRKPLESKDLLQTVERLHNRCRLKRMATEPDIGCVLTESKTLVFGNDTKNLSYIINQAVCNAGSVCKDIGSLKVALNEVVLNAIEHGNLGITMEEKSKADENGTYHDLLAQKCRNPQYENRVVRMDVYMDREQLIYTITDEGSGFDYSTIFDTDPSSHIGSGLGLFIVRSFFTEVIFGGCGNKVKLIYKKNPEQKLEGAQGNPSEELIYKLINTLSSGFMVLSQYGCVCMWNDAAEAITSISRSDIIGTRREDLPEEIAGLLNPETREIMVTTNEHNVRYIMKSLHEIELNNAGRNTVIIFTDITELMNQKQEMELLLMETSETKDLMEEQAARLAMALAEVDGKNEIIQGQNKRMVDELKMAGRLQKSLLPNIYENINGVSVSSKYIPSIHIGGDLYDIVDTGQGMTGFIIADVSGHGVAAALVSSMFKMSFHTLATNVASPKILFHMLNKEFNQILAEDYITGFYLLADSVRRTITYANAAHPTPLLYKKGTSEIIELDTAGFFIGMFEEGMYEERTISNIEKGDALLLFTDCILEAENPKGEPFGKTRLKDSFLRALGKYHGQDVIDAIESEVRRYSARHSFNDDFTVLLLEFWEQAPSVNPDLPGDYGPETDGFIEF